MAKALLASEPMGYTEAFGLRPLRERIALRYARHYGQPVPVDRIAVTVGASGAFPLAFLAAFDPGDTVAMAAPYYPPYANILTALGMRPLTLPCDASTRFQPTVAMLEKLDPRPAGLIVASPCNPAGTMLAPAELAAIARWHPIVRHDGRVSIARSFRPPEWRAILAEAGIDGARVFRAFPFRLCVECVR